MSNSAAPSRADLYAAVQAIAPFELAESWDNVGVLLDPWGTDEMERVLLTIDLTEAVADEAIGWGADAIVAYHPPIFSGLKRLTAATAQERTILRLVANGIPVVSPHTALDAAAGGMGDWLAATLGDAAMVAPITPCKARPLDSTVGLGRMGVLAEPAALDVVVERVKQALGLAHVRLATAARHRDGAPIRRFAVCPGAGGELFSQVGAVDLLLTGEMRHHDVLARVHAGTSVLLTDHTNCERGYLPTLGAALAQRLPGLLVRISERDADPLVVR